jgi:hypothetical protein
MRCWRRIDVNGATRRFCGDTDGFAIATRTRSLRKSLSWLVNPLIVECHQPSEADRAAVAYVRGQLGTNASADDISACSAS